ncbi:phosphotransferase, partial [Elstera litoralis]|uniref:phosphotransferase n=1 Tax=Elstera litoralis TaxID=552518 RepID=UPI0012ED70D5
PADLPAADTPHTPDQWERLRARAEARLFPLLSAHLAEELRAHLRAMDGLPLKADAPGLIHDDLHPAHILHDPASGRLTGLLDFGRSGRGDAAVDLAGLLYNWGSGLLNGLAYPDLPAHFPRAQALARTYEVQWALEGIERQDLRWLLYALGAAKDF